MTTEKLIDALTADLGGSRGAAHARLRWPRLAASAGSASLITLTAILLLLSRNPHLAYGPDSTLVFSVLAGLALAAGAFWATLTLSCPEGRPGFWWLLFPATILLTGLGLEMARTSSARWSELLWGDSPAGCFSCVTLLSLPILTAVLMAMRRGAPAQPRRAGAVAGLLAGGITAALYTLHCPEDSLLFVAFWHVLAIATVACLGAFVGSRWLRW